VKYIFLLCTFQCIRRRRVFLFLWRNVACHITSRRDVLQRKQI